MNFSQFSKKKQIGFTILGWLIFFVLLEGSSRLLFIAMAGSDTAITEEFMIVPKGDEKWWVLDPYLFWRLKPNDPRYGTNTYSFRGPETSVKTADNTKRILMIGDSSTYGIGVRYRDTYAYKLEEMLNNNSKKNVKWEVLNAGVPGYSSLQGLRHLNRLVQFKPDIIVAYFGANDLSATDLPDGKQPILFDVELDSILLAVHKSYFYQLIKGIMFYLEINYYRPSIDANEEKSYCRVEPDDFERNMKEMVTTAKRCKSEIFFIPYLRWFNNRLLSYNNLSHNKLKYNVEGGRVIDIKDAFLAYENQLHMLFCDDVHPTQKGHLLIAVEIYNSFKKAGIL